MEKTTMTLAERRQMIAVDRKALTVLKGTIDKIVKTLDLDDERIIKRVDNALRSEYGAVNGVINLLASIANWPVEPNDGAQVATNRQILANKLNLDLMLLEEIRASRGYHTFVSDDMKIINGQAPDYETYSQLCQIFIEELLGEELAEKPAISQTKWEQLEQVAKDKAALDLEQRMAELEMHKAFIEAKTAT